MRSLRQKATAFIEGKFRKKLFYSKWFGRFLPLHIFEQINYRIFVMNRECLSKGACIECGCPTPDLQMANGACEGKCYPDMMDATDWHIYKQKRQIEFRYWDTSKPREFELRITHKPIIL
jgi:hypothetical protein